MAAATAVAFLLRVLDLDLHGLWLDELFTVRVVSRESWAGLLAEVAQDVHPPSYFAFLRLWTGLLGDSEVVLRLPSVLAGTAAVPLTALLGRQLYGGGAGTVGAWLVATSPFLVLLDREARSNSLLVLAATGLALACLGPPGRLRTLLAAGLGAAVAVQLHAFGYVAVVLGLSWALLTHGRGSLPLLGAVGLGTLTAAPWWPSLLAQGTRFAEDPWYRLPSPDLSGWLLTGLSADQPGVLALLVAGLGLALIRHEARGHTLIFVAISAYLLLPALISLALAPVLRPRNVAPLLPLLCVIAGAGWSSLRPRASAVAVGLVLVGLQGWAAWTLRLDPPNRQAWREAAATVAAGWREGDLLLANHPHLWRHYLPEHIEPRAWDAPLPDGLARTWGLVGHDLPDPLIQRLEREAGPRLWARFDPGASVLFHDSGWRPLGRDRFPPGEQVDDRGVHLYWNGEVRSEPLTLHGDCRLRAKGHGELVDDEPARVRAAWLRDGEEVVEAHWELPAEPVVLELGTLQQPGPRAEARLSLRFLNDGSVAGEDGVLRDRNAHLEELELRCEPR